MSQNETSGDEGGLSEEQWSAEDGEPRSGQVLSPALASLFALARRMHLAGGFAVAEHAYRQVLMAVPEHAEALHHLGMIAFQTGHQPEALELVRRSVTIRPDNAEAVNDLGWICLSLEKIHEAIAFAREAIALAPDAPRFHVLLANALRRDSQWDEAIEHFLIGSGKTSDETMVLLGLALCHLAKDKTETAFEYIEKLEQLDPEMNDIHYLKGIALQRPGKQKEALPFLSRAFQNAPDNARLAVDLAMALNANAKFDAAEATLRYAETHNPDDAGLLSTLCHILINQKKYAEAEAYGRRAVALNPEFPGAYNNLGRAYEQQWKLVDAEMSFRQALRILPDTATEITNLSMLLGLWGKLEESLPLAERAHAIDPEHPGVHLNLALRHLQAGSLARGWEIYELSKYKTQRAVLFDVDVPHLEVDENPDGMTVLVRREQGIGDVILFASVLPDLIRDAGHCIVECLPKTVTLLQRSFPTTRVIAVSTLRDMGKDVAADRQIQIGSLNRRYRMTPEKFPNPHKFLIPDPERVEDFRRRLKALPGEIKVAVLWRGRLPILDPSVEIDYLLPEQLVPILKLPGLTFISVQYDAEGNLAHQEIEELREKYGVVVHEFDDLDTFNDLDGVAALLEACDVALGPKTATLHIAGGLGKPTLRWSGSPDHFCLGQLQYPLTPSVRSLALAPIYDKDEIVRLLLEQFPAFVTEHTGYVIAGE